MARLLFLLKTAEDGRKKGRRMSKIIAGHELAPGKTVRDYCHVEGTGIDVPYVLLCGMQPGPTVLISAGGDRADR